MENPASRTLAERAHWGPDHVTMTFFVPWRPGFAVFGLVLIASLMCVGQLGPIAAVLGIAALVALRQPWAWIAREPVLFRMDARCAWLDGANNQLAVWELADIERIEDHDGRLRIAGSRSGWLDLRCLDETDRAWLEELLRTAVDRARARGTIADNAEELAALRRVIRRA